MKKILLLLALFLNVNFAFSQTISPNGSSGSGTANLVVGTSTITSGTNTRVLFDNSGTLGEYSISGTGSVCMTTSCSMTTPILGTPTSGTLTNTTGFPLANLAGAGTGVLTALGVNTGSAGAVVLFNGALGTPSSGVGTNLTSLNASNLASGTVAAARGGAGTINGALKANGSGVVSQAACADLSNGASGCSAAVTSVGTATVGQIPGVSSNTGANVGSVGEIQTISVAFGSPISLTTSTAKTITSVSLTAGDWMIYSSSCLTGGATTVLSYWLTGISTSTDTAASVDIYPGYIYPASYVPFATSRFCMPVTTSHVLINSTTSYFLTAFANFTTSTLSAYGTITAVRIR